MVVKVYISGISGNKEVKKRQQRVLMILESKGVTCEVVDITEPGREAEKEFMQKNSKLRDDSRYPLPPQLFNDEEYCGDYDDFDLSNEIDELEKFLKVPKTVKDTTKSTTAVGNGTVNGIPGSREASAERTIDTPTQIPTEESSKPAPAEEPAEEPEQPAAEVENDAEPEEKEEEAEEEEEGEEEQ